MFSSRIVNEFHNNSNRPPSWITFFGNSMLYNMSVYTTVRPELQYDGKVNILLNICISPRLYSWVCWDHVVVDDPSHYRNRLLPEIKNNIVHSVISKQPMIIIKQELQALCNVQESACMWDIVNTGLDFGLDFWMYLGLLRFYVFFTQRIPCFFKIFTIN